jgi:regulatory protein
MQRDGGADSPEHLAPVIDLFRGKGSPARVTGAAAPSSLSAAASDERAANEAPDPVPHGSTRGSWGSDNPSEVIAKAQAAIDEILSRPPSAGVAKIDLEAADAVGALNDEPAPVAPVRDRPPAGEQWWSDDDDSAAELASESAQAPSTPVGEESTSARAIARRRWAPALPADRVDEPTAPAPRLAIEEASTRALARRGLSVTEMRTMLTTKGYTEDQVESEVERLLRARYLDDARLAEEIVRVEFERKGKGRAVVTAELRRRGVSPDDFATALDDIDTELELQRAADIAYRKMVSSSDLDARTAERRLSALLARRGFSGDLARLAIARASERLAAGG